MASGGSSRQSSYDQEPKKDCRKRLIEHAVQCLTTGRETSACVVQGHVRNVWKQLHESGKTCFTGTQISDIEKEIKNWELFHKSRIQTREPSDLRVCYLAGNNPMNDLEVLIDNGVICQNIWAIDNDAKALKEAWKSTPITRNVRLFKGNFLDFIKDFAEDQFDIIYFDACGTLPSAKQKTLKAIGYIFLYNKLTSPGALITNFSFPPEMQTAKTNPKGNTRPKAKNKEGKNANHKAEKSKERENLGDLSRTYLKCRLENTLRGDLILKYEDGSLRSVEENYSDYITYQIIDTAYMYIPALRMLSSKTDSLWGQLYDRKKYKFLEDVEERRKSSCEERSDSDSDSDSEQEHTREPLSGFLFRLGQNLEQNLELNRSNNCFRNAWNSWGEEVLPDWKSSNALKNSENLNVSSLLLTHLLTNSYDFIHSYCNDSFLNDFLTPFFGSPEKTFLSFHDVADQDLKKCTSQRTSTLLYGQMAHPSFPVVNKTLRLKYTAKRRQMFSDVFIFDKCRYVYDQFPSVDYTCFAVCEPQQQIVCRMVLDGLRKHLEHIFDDLFEFCDVSSVVAVKEGGVEFSNCLHHIPNRLDVD